MKLERKLAGRTTAALLAVAGLAAGACTMGLDRKELENGGGGGGGGPGAVCDPLVARAHLPCDDADVKSALALLRTMTLDEKVQQMSGPAYNPNNMFEQQDNERLQLPGLKYLDGPRGVRWYNSTYGTTVFPVAAARASSWDVELERRIGKASAKELRALGSHVLLAPTINQVTHPRWGRAQETYGEDSYLLGAFGASFIQGAEYDPTKPDAADPDHVVEDTYRVQACVKHLAANNIEDTRIYVNAVLDERTLREVYLPHFKKASDLNVSCVMASYNRVNGSYACYSQDIIRKILKEEWGYSGYVISDWFAKGNTLTSPAAGLDVEMPFSSGSFPSMFDSQYFYGSALATAVADKRVDEALVDEAVLRILYRKVAYGLTRKPKSWAPWTTKSDAAQALALRSAREGIVLLKNGPEKALADDVLPLSRAALSKIAVVGKFANSENMGDKGSSDAKVVDGELVITPFEGIRDAFAGAGKSVVTYETVAGNTAALQSSDVVVVVTAYYYADLARSSSGEEGEWKDREGMGLVARDLANVQGAIALKAGNPNLKVVVVLKSGGAVVVDDWVAGADAVLMAWYAGMSEGQALAEILFGDVTPSGKTVQSFPRREADLPRFENATTGDVVYSYYHGYRWLERQDIAPRYAFGHGLSYTTFGYSEPVLSSQSVAADGTLSVSVDVTNTGSRPGAEVVQLYVGYDNTQVKDTWGRSKKELKAFARTAELAPGATEKVTLTVKVADLAYWDVAAKGWKVERMTHQLYVGPSSDTSEPNTRRATFSVQ